MSTLEVQKTPRKIHPFPARMAPEIALLALNKLPAFSTVLDPMCGSGTVLQQAQMLGHQVVGFDLDPLAVLMSRITTTYVNGSQLIETGEKIASKAAKLKTSNIVVPWIDSSLETKEFTEFWFAEEQRCTLRALALLVSKQRGLMKDALGLAMSKLIITKGPCASLARDTSHSRPHRVTLSNTYNVNDGFLKAVAQLAHIVEYNPKQTLATVKSGDARKLPTGVYNKVDMVITSPPYGNAIDYLRGHRLSLVWLGYNISELRIIRRRIIGGSSLVCDPRRIRQIDSLMSEYGELSGVDKTTKKRLKGYTNDIFTVLAQIYKALKVGGRAVLVIGNSISGDQPLDNSKMIVKAAETLGFGEISKYTRPIPANRRYLPPPENSANEHLSRRMQEEVVLTLQKND